MKKFRRLSNHADLADSQGSALSIGRTVNKKRVLTWTVSALMIVAAPVAVFAWSVDSNHLSNTSANPMVKLDETAADSTNDSNGSSPTSNSNTTTPPVTNNNANSNVTTTGTQSNTSTTNVVVNGQTIPAPSNGTTTQTVTSSNGQPTQVVIQHSQTSQGSSTNSNSTNVSVNSSSNSSSDSQ